MINHEHTVNSRRIESILKSNRFGKLSLAIAAAGFTKSLTDAKASPTFFGKTSDHAARALEFPNHSGLSIVCKTLASERYLPLRSVARPEESDAALSGVKTIIIDGTEQRIQRPQDTEEQRLYYSGKKKAHTYKSLIVSDDDNYIHYVSYVYVGTSSEISILEEEFDPQFNWFDGYTVRVDLGYVGFDKNIRKLNYSYQTKSPEAVHSLKNKS